MTTLPQATTENTAPQVAVTPTPAATAVPKAAPKAAAKPAVKPAVKVATKAVTKAAAKPVAKKAMVAVKVPAKSVASKALAKAVPPPKPVVKVVKPAPAAKPTKTTQATSSAAASAAAKSKKPKLVRDSFTIPKNEYEAIASLKERALKQGVSIKKSELLRAGLMTLAFMPDTAFAKALADVPTLKTGRPANKPADKKAK